jgi:hypothetical protein
MPRVRRYCPGCQPQADPIREILVQHWCEAHAPTLNGADDTAVGSTGEPGGRDESAGCDNRRWCELFHGRAQRSDAGGMDYVADHSTHVVVIRRGEAEMFAWFRARYDEQSDATVIWDRRIGERRTRVREISAERRARERRSPRGTAWDAFGFVLATRRR